jgi:beta-galactosidase/beta-glucuronidase
MLRSGWLNLNGQWDFGITPLTQTNADAFPGQILVPFPVESTLSGAKHPLVTERQRMWYRRQFSIPKGWQGQRVLLHFGAVDWETKVWVNGRGLGVHQGGYDSFNFDITDALKLDGEQQIVVSVFDPTDSGAQPRGKQMQHPRQPFFSACSGIWQTVWLEPVPVGYIDSLKLVPDIDAGVLKVTVQGCGQTNDVTVEAIALDGDSEAAHVSARIGEGFQIPISNAKLWSPDNPFLYNLKVTLLHDGKKLDSVTSYFGMRKISIAKDESGFPQMMLNNQRLFQLGPLDQGYWPDGIYTAPTDEALRYDIEVMKQFGFNMCRKHVKIEPERWYYWCDKLGLLVWQDMPNGDYPATVEQKEIKRQPEVARQFEQELGQMIGQRGNHPCIVMWILFNQGWGQYDTARITSLCKEQDTSRLIISASGWHDMNTGDVASFHKYPVPMGVQNDGKRACVVGECGALALVMPGNLWGGIGRWNTTYFKDPERLAGGYTNLISDLMVLKNKAGLSAAVITQLTDVEAELDGFVTYDRAIIKMPVQAIRAMNEKIIANDVKHPAISR